MIEKLNFGHKVTNGGATQDGRLTASEFNRIPEKIDEIIDKVGNAEAVSLLSFEIDDFGNLFFTNPDPGSRITFGVEDGILYHEFT